MSYSFRVDEDGNIIWRVGVSGSLIGFREMRIDWEGNEKRARLERILAMRILMQK